jgi:hypothetical protein
MARWSIPRVRDNDSASINRTIEDLNLILAELEQLEQQLKGQGGYVAELSSDLQMNGNRIRGLPSRPKNDDEPASWRYQKSGAFLFSEDDVFITNKAILGVAAASASGLVTLDQLQALLAGATGGFIPGSIIFAGPTGQLDEDNPSLFYNKTTKRIGLGTVTPLTSFSIGPVSAALGTTSMTNLGLSISRAGTTVIGAENTNAQGVTAGAFIVLYSNDATAMQANNRLGGFLFGGSSSATAVRNSGGVAAFAENNWTDGSDYGTYVDVQTTAPGSTTRTRKLRVTGAGNVIVGSAALATTATDGFLYIPTCAGTPTGTPTAYTGMAPLVYDTTNNKLYVYSGAAWKRAQVGGVDAIYA